MTPPPLNTILTGPPVSNMKQAAAYPKNCFSLGNLSAQGAPWFKFQKTRVLTRRATGFEGCHMCLSCRESGLCVFKTSLVRASTWQLGITYTVVAQRSRRSARSHPGYYKLQSHSTRARTRLHRSTYRFSNCDACHPEPICEKS